MSIIASLAVELAAMAAVVSGIQFFVLAFRNPHRPAWLRAPIVESVAVVTIVMTITLSVSTLVAGMIGAGLNVFAALAAGAALPLAVAFINERLFRVRARLRQADAGQSPFQPLPAQAAVQVDA